MRNFEEVAADRRMFLKNMAAGLATSTVVSHGARAENASDSGRLVDTHLHCFAGPNDSQFPYHKDAPYRPPEKASPEHLLQCMQDGGIDYAIVVHPEPYQDDHRYLEYCLHAGTGRLKGTCLFFADRPNAISSMRELVKRLPIVAARIHAYAPERLPPFDSPQLRSFWKAAGELGLAIQLHFEPRYAGGFEPLIEEYRDTRVIIDHLGRPMQGTPEEHGRVVRWARFPNTIMKLSAIPSPLNYPHRDGSQIISRLVMEYGAERMIFGGGFTSNTTGNSYRAAFESARSVISQLSAAEQALVLGGNAVRLFGFGA